MIIKCGEKSFDVNPESPCVVCGKVARLHVPDPSSMVPMKNPRGEATIMFPLKMISFCGTECEKKYDA